MRNRSVVPALLLAVVLALAVPVARAGVCIAPPNPNNPFWLWSKFCEMCESHGGTFWGADGSDRHNRTVDGNTTYGLRMMWTNRASGNISNSILMRQLCVGDFSTRRRGSLNVSRRRNWRNTSFQRSTTRGGRPSRSKAS